MYFFFAVVIGASIGAVACLPQPQSDLRHALISIGLGVVGAFLGWEASISIGERQVGPWAELFVSVIAAGALVSLYHALRSEKSTLN